MSPVPDNLDARAEREPFVAGWTGALAVGLFIYIPITLLLTFADGSTGPAFEVFKLFSDFPASVGSALLASVAAWRAAEPAVKRTWSFLAATMWVYTTGNLLNSTYWLFGVDPFPSVGDVFFMGFYPLLFTAIFTAIRAAASPTVVGSARLSWSSAGMTTAPVFLAARACRSGRATPCVSSPSATLSTTGSQGNNPCS